MAISQNFPAVSPTLNLNFARSKKLDPRITFTRSSSATRTNAQGLVETVSANIPRFDHSYNSSTGSVNSLGLLIEESRTNLVTYSAYNASTWSKIETTGTGTLTTGIDAPDGSTNAVRFTCNNNGNILLRVSIPAFTPNGTDTYTTSFYVRKISGTGNASTDLTDGNPSGDYSSRLITNQWVRITTSGVPTATSKTFIDLFSDQNTNYVLDFWGVQIENGAFATSLIPTSGSTVTRSADNASITGTNFSSWYNPSEGSVLSIAKTNFNVPANKYPRVFEFNDATFSNQINHTYYSPGKTYSTVRNSDTYVFDTGYTVTDETLTRKICSAYSNNNFGMSVNGLSTLTDSSGNVPTNLNRMEIGSYNNIDPLNGTISQLTYYPRRLTNTQLQNLTK